eukprot:s2052_g6.t1
MQNEPSQTVQRPFSRAPPDQRSARRPVELMIQSKLYSKTPFAKHDLGSIFGLYLTRSSVSKRLTKFSTPCR